MSDIPSAIPPQTRCGANAGRSRFARLVLALAFVLPLAACSATRSRTVPTATAAPTVAVSAAATPIGALATPTAATPSPTAQPTATRPPTSTPAPSAAAAASPASATPSGADVDAIKNVIQRGNQEEQQALAADDPTLMRDTATASYYNDLMQTLNDLVSSGVTKIELLKLEWGSIVLQGSTTAQATTVETWRTTFSDGGTLEGPDTNVYTLVQESGAWKIQADEHPGSRPSQPSPGTTGATPTPVPPTTPVNPGQSRNWAGYSASGGTYTAVSGSWTVPTVSPSNTPAADATWVGIGGVDSRDLIQAGTDATVARGQVSYEAWLEMLPDVVQPVPLDVTAGDKVSVTITQQPDGTWQIVIRNTTTQYVYQVNETYASSRSSAEWIEEAPDTGRRSQLPLDNFGSVTFTGATTVKDGKQLTIAGAGGQAITMSVGGQPVAQPSALGADGASFTVTRVNPTGLAAPPAVVGAPPGLMPAA